MVFQEYLPLVEEIRNSVSVANSPVILIDLVPKLFLPGAPNSNNEMFTMVTDDPENNFDNLINEINETYIDQIESGLPIDPQDVCNCLLSITLLFCSIVLFLELHGDIHFNRTYGNSIKMLFIYMCALVMYISENIHRFNITREFYGSIFNNEFYEPVYNGFTRGNYRNREEDFYPEEGELNEEQERALLFPVSRTVMNVFRFLIDMGIIRRGNIRRMLFDLVRFVCDSITGRIYEDVITFPETSTREYL